MPKKGSGLVDATEYYLSGEKKLKTNVDLKCDVAMGDTSADLVGSNMDSRAPQSDSDVSRIKGGESGKFTGRGEGNRSNVSYG